MEKLINIIELITRIAIAVFIALGILFVPLVMAIAWPQVSGPALEDPSFFIFSGGWMVGMFLLAKGNIDDGFDAGEELWKMSKEGWKARRHG